MILLSQLLDSFNPNELIELRLRANGRKIGQVSEPMISSDIKHILTKEGARSIVKDIYSDVLDDSRSSKHDITTYTIVTIDNSAEPCLITLE